MHKKPSLLVAMFAGSLTAGMMPAVSHAVIADGRYAMNVLTTPTYTTYYGGTGYLVGSDGAWNSSLTFGNLPANATLCGLEDNDVTATGSDGVPRGSGVAGDGYAGVIGLQVLGGAISVDSFSVDTVLNTPFGDFAKYAPDVSAMSGSVDLAGNMLFTPTGQLATPSILPHMADRAWNIDDWDCVSYGESCTYNGNTDWVPFTTGTVSSLPGSITGAPVTEIGDINGDGLMDYAAILVAAGEIGSEWGCCSEVPYYEIWNVQIVSTEVPLPAAAWLLGGGLAMLGGIGSRRRLTGESAGG